MAAYIIYLNIFYIYLIFITYLNIFIYKLGRGQEAPASGQGSSTFLCGSEWTGIRDEPYSLSRDEHPR